MPIKAKKLLSNGVKTVTHSRQQLSLFCVALVLVAAALLSLNVPQFFFEPFPLWCRIVDQALLVVGLLGSVLRIKWMRVAGWVGICVFIAYVVIGSFPSLDHPAFDSNGEQRPEQWMFKLMVWLVISVSLAVCFKKLSVRSQPP